MGYTAIVDYGVGNLLSVSNAMAYLGLQSTITDDAKALEGADSIILPGVGAFPDAAELLQRSGLGAAVVAQADNKPVLGICLGMQLLFDRSEEGRPCAGLGLIPGDVRKIETAEKLPHIGWNQLSFPNPSPLFAGIPEGESVYFVHSYRAIPTNPADIIAVTDYGASVTAAVGRGNVYGCQFHPEKSGEAGLLILKNFGELNR